MLCPYCGMEVNANVDHCPKCGKDLRARKETRGMPRWIIILALIAVAASAVTGIFVYRAETSKQEIVASPVQDLLENLKSNKAQEAYKRDFSKEFISDTSLEEWQAFIAQYPILADYSSYEIKEGSKAQASGTTVADLKKGDASTPVEFTLVQEEGSWKISGIRILLPPASASAHEGALNADQMRELVRQHIELLEKSQTDKAYNFVTNEFKNVTSLDQFKKFLVKYPIFFKHSSYELADPKVQKGYGTLQAAFQNNEGRTVMEYTLSMEDGKLRINGMRLLETSPAEEGSKPADFDPKPLLDSIEGQLGDLRKGKTLQAYDEYTSKEFKKSTSYEEFENFVKSYAVFKPGSEAKLNRLTFNNNIATYTGILTDKNKNKFAIEYDLINEDGKWKILHIQLFPPSSEAFSEAFVPEGPLEITSFDIGTSVDSSGAVINPAQHLANVKGQVYVTLHVKNGVKGNELQLTFKHLDSKTNIPPVPATLEENGDSAVSFVFTPPPKGWPSGKYELEVKLPDGKSKTFAFSMEQDHEKSQ